MKRWISILLAAALVMGCALAEDFSMNMDAGGKLAENSWFGVSGDLPGDLAYCVQAVGEEIWWVDNGVYSGFMEGTRLTPDTLRRMRGEDDWMQIGEPRGRGREKQWSEDGETLLQYTRYVGYRDMTVVNDAVYFIGNDGQAGSYAFETADGAGYEIEYLSGQALYRMDLDGGNLRCLVSGLGNSECRMAVHGDRIALASCWKNPLDETDFVRFTIHDLEGGLIETIENDDRASAWMEGAPFTLDIQRMQTDGREIYASIASGEEWDFASLLVDVRGMEPIAYEAFGANSRMTDRGLAYVAYPGQSFAFDSAFIDGCTLRLRTQNGDRILALMPYWAADSGAHISVLGEMVYVRMGESMMRVPIRGGTVEMWREGIFEPAPEYDPENAPSYIPASLADAGEYLLWDSDCRAYSAGDLAHVDTETLGYMRNEILARHGYVFQKAHYRDYFSARGWYAENPDFDYAMLSRVEMANVETIKAIEASR